MLILLTWESRERIFLEEDYELLKPLVPGPWLPECKSEDASSLQVVFLNQLIHSNSQAVFINNSLITQGNGCYAVSRHQ
jgi:hypothetical protein